MKSSETKKRNEVAFMFEALIEDMILARGGSAESVEGAKVARDRFMASPDADVLEAVLQNFAATEGEHDEEIMAIWVLAETCLRTGESTDGKHVDPQ